MPTLLPTAHPLSLVCKQAKQRVLKDTLHKINLKHGAGTVMQMTDGAVNV